MEQPRYRSAVRCGRLVLLRFGPSLALRRRRITRRRSRSFFVFFFKSVTLGLVALLVWQPIRCVRLGAARNWNRVEPFVSFSATVNAVQLFQGNPMKTCFEKKERTLRNPVKPDRLFRSCLSFRFLNGTRAVMGRFFFHLFFFHYRYDLKRSERNAEKWVKKGIFCSLIFWKIWGSVFRPTCPACGRCGAAGGHRKKKFLRFFCLSSPVGPCVENSHFVSNPISEPFIGPFSRSRSSFVFFWYRPPGGFS